MYPEIIAGAPVARAAARSFCSRFDLLVGAVCKGERKAASTLEAKRLLRKNGVIVHYRRRYAIVDSAIN